MAEIIAAAKGMQWMLVFIVLPLLWKIYAHHSASSKEWRDRMMNKQEQDAKDLAELQKRMVKLEAEYVTKSELVALLQKMEESIEMRFDRSFEKLERSVLTMFELRDKQDK